MQNVLESISAKSIFDLINWEQFALAAKVIGVVTTTLFSFIPNA